LQFRGLEHEVMINDISHDLHTDVEGVQTTITPFLVIMAVLMIPCSKLTDRWGRKRCLIGGLTLYGISALVSAVAPGLGVLILGYSVFQGVGTAFLIPPVYILTAMAFTSLGRAPLREQSSHLASAYNPADGDRYRTTGGHASGLSRAYPYAVSLTGPDSYLQQSLDAARRSTDARPVANAGAA
jgi:hypothetical protein